MGSGAERQIGILFATDLLILNPNAGFDILVAITVRVILKRRYGNKVQLPMYVLAAGFIAGATLYSFFTSTLGLFTRRRGS